MRPLPPLALTLLGLLPLAACIENSLTIELTTRIQPDGSCIRRVEYRLERIDTEQGRARTAIPPAEDPLRKHFRFPSGEPWQLSEQVETGLHVVTIEAQLPSPQDVEGDYYMARSPKAHPARNLVSALVDTEHDVYEYQEVLRDPSSPLATARTLSRLALKSDPVFAQAFAEAFATAVEGKTAAPRIPDVRRLYRELLAEPFAREVAALAERPLYGPRERRELDEIYDRMDERQKQFAARLSVLTTGVPLDQLDEVTESAFDTLGTGLLVQLESLGLPSPVEARPTLRFRATLVMPLPILRANTCFTGDTAVWEFEEEDLFGRGFEMKALASSR